MITLSIVLLLILTIGLGVLFYFLHERVESLALNLSQMLQDQETFKENQETLRKNQETLSKDFKQLFYDCQGTKKEIGKVKRGT